MSRHFNGTRSSGRNAGHGDYGRYPGAATPTIGCTFYLRKLCSVSCRNRVYYRMLSSDKTFPRHACGPSKRFFCGRSPWRDHRRGDAHSTSRGCKPSRWPRSKECQCNSRSMPNVSWKRAVFKNKRTPICCLSQIAWHISVAASRFPASTRRLATI
jgi:hypothetical protein